MKLSIIAAIASAFASISLGAPAPTDDSTAKLDTRAPIAKITYCLEPNFKTCRTPEVVKGDCNRVHSDYQGKISSVNTYDGAGCILYETPDCHGKPEGKPEFIFTSPGITDLKAVYWNDRAQSYKCF